MYVNQNTQFLLFLDNPGSHGDIPEETEVDEKDEEEVDSKKSTMEATKGGKKKVESEAVKIPQRNGNKFTVMVVGISVAIIVFLIFIIVVIVLVQKNKRRNNGLYFLGRKQLDYGTNAYIDGSDVDNIHLEIRKKGSPLPDVVHPDKVKSPLMDTRKAIPKVRNRSVDSNLVNLAGKTPTTIQKQAWEQMKQKQDEIISDEEDEHFLEDEAQADNLPLPPDYMLVSGQIPGAMHQDDAASYQDIIEGYHSGDNMDEGEENDFEIRVPSGYEQNSYISYDPVT